MTTNANRRVTDEQIERARSIDLVQFLQQYEPPGELKRIGQSWTLKSHDSMRISADGRWNWFSQNKGGGDAIGFLQAVHGMSFQDAVRTLAGEDFKTIPATQAEHKAKPPERTAFALPPKNNGMPVFGLTLPFFSYGGSSIVTLFAAMGMVSSVQSHSLPDWLR